MRYPWTLIVFGLIFMTNQQGKAQQLVTISNSEHNTQVCHINIENNANGTGIFNPEIHSLRDVRYSGTMSHQLLYLDTSPNIPTAFNGPLTPKSAVFCQFENKLWKSFDIGIRLRVETPVFLH